MALDEKTNPKEVRILFGGRTDEQLATVQPLQADFGGGQTDGFLSVIVNR